jgi:hypothetical protein
MKRRIYTDTSVIGGCLDVEFEDASRKLLDMFKTGEAILVLSDLTLLELQGAPASVRAVLEEVPAAHREYVELTEDAAILAQRYWTLAKIPHRRRHHYRCIGAKSPWVPERRFGTLAGRQEGEEQSG